MNKSEPETGLFRCTSCVSAKGTKDNSLPEFMDFSHFAGLDHFSGKQQFGDLLTRPLDRYRNELNFQTHYCAEICLWQAAAVIRP